MCDDLVSLRYHATRDASEVEAPPRLERAVTGLAVVSTTVASDAAAKDLARALVGARLAACVQIMPIASVYRWKGKIETAGEYLLLCKITAEDFADVATAIRARHGYETPEIIMTPIEAGAASYLDWVREETRR